MNISQKSTALLLVGATLAMLSGCEKNENAQLCRQTPQEAAAEPFDRQKAQAELAELKRQYREAGTSKCCQRYVEKVINEGSNVLNMPSGAMDAGYASKEDAKKIAAYVVTLSGKKSLYPEYLQEGNMLYNGNCGGCHGNDGKGLGGSHPDLTLPLLKGAKIQKEKVAKQIRDLEEKLNMKQ